MKSEPKNIRAFNWLTLKILSHLYDNFPEPVYIDGLHFTISTLIDVGPESNEAEYLSYLTATVRWLRSEGFLSYSSEDGGNFHGVVLSLRGLTVLGYEPSSLFGRRESMISKIKGVLSRGVEEAATDTVRTILTRFLALSASAAIGRLG